MVCVCEREREIEMMRNGERETMRDYFGKARNDFGKFISKLR